MRVLHLAEMKRETALETTEFSLKNLLKNLGILKFNCSAMRLEMSYF
jgi:hypothetical protein